MEKKGGLAKKQEKIAGLDGRGIKKKTDFIWPYFNFNRRESHSRIYKTIRVLYLIVYGLRSTESILFIEMKGINMYIIFLSR